MDWMILLIVGLLMFLAWHVTTSPHPEQQRDTREEERANGMKQRATVPLATPSKAAAMIQKAPTVFAEPGLSGQVIDPVPTARHVPLEAPMFSSLAMPF